MIWQEAESYQRRPLVLVEDHLYHIGEVLDLIQREAPEWTRLLTVVCLDRPGADTTEAVQTWLHQFPALQLAARFQEGELSKTPIPARLAALEPGDLDCATDMARRIAGFLRPGGLLLQDVQLETLTFIPQEKWWESIYLASSARGLFADNRPACRFLSNKRGYEATFGRDLAEAGFDPRDVLDKGELGRHLIPTVRSYLARQMPLLCRGGRRGNPEIDTVIGRDESDRQDLERAFDLVLWMTPQGMDLGGKVLTRKAAGRIRLRLGSPEGETWRALAEDFFADNDGLQVSKVGERVAPDNAGRAEITNCAARHIHQLRARLDPTSAIRTIHHSYQLDHCLRIAMVES